MRIFDLHKFLSGLVFLAIRLRAVSAFVTSPSTTRIPTLFLLPENRNRIESNLLSAVSPSNEKAVDDEPTLNNKLSEDDEDADDWSMPWSNNQHWALRDNLPKYTVHIPLVKGGKKVMVKCALWKTMSQEVTEIAGYPLDFLQNMYSRQAEQDTKHDKSEGGDEQNAGNDIDTTAPAVLPYLDLFEFTSSGGALGNVYGVPGLADGTRIETSPVDKVQETLPKGYIRTMDGSAAYELGRPVSSDVTVSIGGSAVAAAATTGTLLKTVANASAKSGKAIVNAAASEVDEDADQMLVRLGASTAILLAGAVAVNMLSHHLTVNVFWV